MVMSLRSKWAAGKARGGRISESIRNRRATQPPTHFQRNPPGRGRLAVFPRCSLLTYQSRYARRSRLEKQPTDLRRHHHYMRDGTLGRLKPASITRSGGGAAVAKARFVDQVELMSSSFSLSCSLCLPLLTFERYLTGRPRQ